MSLKGPQNSLPGPLCSTTSLSLFNTPKIKRVMGGAHTLTSLATALLSESIWTKLHRQP